MNKEKENIKNNSEWEVLTPTGWQDFEGIKKIEKDQTIEIVLDQNYSLKCSTSHQIFVNKNNECSFLFAELVERGDFVLCDDDQYRKVESVEKRNETCDMYDLINVSNGFEYYTNHILSHNCAYIENFDELWVGISPAISTGGSAILLSSPSGVGTMFHRLWVGAKNEQNEFVPVELPWYVHPDRDEQWFEEEKAKILPAKGERGVASELLCNFAASGDTFLPSDTIDRLYGYVEDPIEYYHNNRDVWVWKRSVSNHKYLIAADIARGDGEDFSAFVVLDTETDEIVADYKAKIPTDQFADLLVEVGMKYNMAIICPEKNNVGYATILKLKQNNYPNLYYEKLHKNIHTVVSTADIGNELPGITINPKNREKMYSKLEEVLRNDYVSTKSKRIFEELQTFIWKKNKPQAQKGYHDDLVSALNIAVNIYEVSGMQVYNEDEMTKAMLAGMSRTSKTLNDLQGNSPYSQAPGGAFPVVKSSQLGSRGNRGSQTMQEYWKWLLGN